mmetsp:Transcript_25460/g.76460  ORF Transcript_25460/g.76460 Transcript_25460/m.76460 type:complete len:163 (-) Transcript_25460:34-522(-)
MVKIKKRRTTSKATRKASSGKRYKKVSHTVPEIAKNWDPRKSRQQNMKRLGLAHDPNRAVPGLPGNPSSEVVEQEVHLELVDAPRGADLQAASRNPRRRPMPEEQQKYIVRLLAKHGSDAAKMARDRKRNPQQFSEQKLRRLVELYEGLEGEDLIVARPAAK